MKYIGLYSHCNGEDELKARGLLEWMKGIFNAPSIKIGRGTTPQIRTHIRSGLEDKGWSGEVQIDTAFDLTVFSRNPEIAFQIQTGNISRAYYDLVKLQHLYARRKIKAAVLAVPSQSAAKNIGSNIASFSRIMNELPLFDDVITVPLTLICFE